MANILIVGHKELISNPIFKQDRNMLDLYIDLKDNDFDYEKIEDYFNINK